MNNKEFFSILNKRKNIKNFTKLFFGINLSYRDKKNITNFLSVIKHRNRGIPISKIHSQTNIPRRKIEHWIFEDTKPLIINLLKDYIQLGNPSKGKVWISINSTRGGLFTGPWIEVPKIIRTYKDLLRVLNQLNKNIEFSEVSFGYILGFLIGDSSKPSIIRKFRTTRRITVRLSKHFPTNKKLGDYVSLCANNLGLRMKKCKDCPPGKQNLYPFYTWISQSSTLIQWIFNVCIGLNDNQKTTYDKINANWILNSSKQFKISFLQGLADSDGFVDFSEQRVGIITHPNTDLVENILNTLEIKSKRRYFTNNGLWALMISIHDAYSLPIFNRSVNSYRYKKLKKLVYAKKIQGHWPEWLSQEVNKNIISGINGTELVKKIIDNYGVAIRTKQITIRKKKWENQKLLV